MLRRPSFAIAASAIAIALALSACSAAPTQKATVVPASGSFPVTIAHAFGKTTLKSAPTRVVTWGWGSADDAIALGVVPVAIPFQSYGGDKAGVLPWISDALKAEKAKTPTVLPDGQEPPYEDIAKARPDVILAAYSGVTQKQYDLLSKIAPVIAYPAKPWATDWRELITITGKALGRPTQAKGLLVGIDKKIAAQAAAHPEFKNKSIALASDTGGTFYVYTKEDPRVAFTLDLGFVSAPSVDSLATDKASFFYTLSHEQLDKLTSDVLVNFAATQKESDAFLSAGYSQAVPQVRTGAVASPVGAAFIASVSPPTGLSLTWGIDDYVAVLSGAAKKADSAK